MKNKASVVVMAIIIAVVLVAIGGGIWYYTTLNRNNSKICQNLWWYDDEHATCQEPKQFCGTYMYQGLEVFETKANCEQNITLKDEITDWKTYKNEEYGFEFKYPKEWPQPTIGGGYLSGGFPQEKSKWTLQISNKGLCEGTDCSKYELSGFSYLDYETAFNSLQKNRFISTLKKTDVNGLKIITYIESGLRENQTALIFGTTQTLKFVNVLSGEKYFTQILSTFKFIESTCKSNVFKLETAKVDDEAACMTIKSIGKYMEGHAPFSTDNASIKFSGEATITGTYHYYDSGILTDRVCVDNLDASSQAKLPKIQGDTRTVWFCFDSQSQTTAKNNFGPKGSSGRTTIIIDEYNVVAFAGEANNAAKLIQVLNK